MSKIADRIPRSVKNQYHRLGAILASLYFGFPSRQLTCIGVTGTNGKTTTCYLLHSILTVAGKKAAMVTTVEARINQESIETGLHVTSPDAWELQKLLKKMTNKGVKYAVLEVTSHAIDQDRFWGVSFEVAALTNITHEHLDYHRSFEEYKKTKLGFLRQAQNSVRPETIDRALINDVKLKLVGSYNHENALVAAGVASVLGIDQASIKKGLEAVEQIPGRMEVVYDRDFKVIIDFAHTPDGLEKALTAARALVPTGKKLIVVFGSAGDRDVEKRPMMGEVAAGLADVIVLTAEDPRSEDVSQIIDQIVQGISVPKSVSKVPDRQKAINLAIRKIAQPGDVVIITGKGHEKSMNYQGTEYPWSDRAAVACSLEAYHPSGY